MRKFLVVLGLMFIHLIPKAQVTYQNYLDCSSEWRYYVNTYQFGGQNIQEFVTKYFDGDTMINGDYYYRQKLATRRLGSAATSVLTNLFLREDSNKNFISYSPINYNVDTLYKFDSIIHLSIGQRPPKTNYPKYIPLNLGGGNINGYFSNCNITKIDSFIFGGRTLRAIYAVDTSHFTIAKTHPCIIEGIGSPFPALCNFGCCDAVPVPNLYYYTKNASQISFNSTSFIYSIDSFPIPIRFNTCSLPLKLLSFTTKLQQNSIALNWQTTNEINVSHINIQRSINGKNFITIGKVNAGSNYNFIDDKFLSFGGVRGGLYYRLEIVDKDGSKTYSDIKRVTLNEKQETRNILIYPNPAKDMVKIECANAKEILILDYLGKIIKQFSHPTAHQTLNTKQLTKGLYIVKAIMNNGEIVTEKFIVN